MTWKTLLAIDSDKWAVATYIANFPGVEVVCGAVADYVGTLPIADIIIGGPPCQPFSDAGENEGEADDRDGMPDFIAAVMKVRPRMFLMENVRGLLKERHLPYFGRVLMQLECLGYRVEYRLFDSAGFGIPQFRERVWAWGIRSDVYAAGVRHCWPKPTHAWPPPEECMFGGALLPGVTVGQALGISGDFAVRTPRSKGAIRLDHPITEPSPCALGGGSAKQLVRVIGGGTNPHYAGEDRTERDITDEPSTTIAAQHTDNALPAIVGVYDAQNDRLHNTDRPCGTIQGEARAKGGKAGHYAVIPYRWSDAMFVKHPPASPASPASPVMAKYYKGGAEGLIAVDAPSHKLSGESREPIQSWRDKGYVRRLTPLECLRLQSGPDDFRWPAKITKTAMYKVVGNGWSSRMGHIFAEAFHAADPQSHTVIDLFCGGGLGAVGWHGRYWSYQGGGACR